ncbi:hypothetical protein BTJ48_03903 [Bacillus mycoides]|nr:hypothetical protein BTJ48_03903 [Bacillus mycoides]
MRCILFYFIFAPEPKNAILSYDSTERIAHFFILEGICIVYFD